MDGMVKVLLVDDEQDFVETLAQRLEVRNFNVQVALRGDEALAMIAEQTIDVVVLDVLMPGRDGVDTLKEIKNIKPLTEVIMLTGHATVETGIQGMKLGAFDYLMKPVETEELVSKIERAFSRKKDQEDRIRQAEIERIMKTKSW